MSDRVSRRMVQRAIEDLRALDTRLEIMGERDQLANTEGDTELPFAETTTHSSGLVNLPSRAYPDDAGLDLYVAETVEIRPQAFVDIHCYLAVQLPPGVWCLIIGRSSTLRKRGLMVNPGIIDTGYRGELFTGVFNMSDATTQVHAGERLAQMILFENITARYSPVKVELLEDSARGKNGFGSSGA